MTDEQQQLLARPFGDDIVDRAVAAIQGQTITELSADLRAHTAVLTCDAALRHTAHPQEPVRPWRKMRRSVITLATTAATIAAVIGIVDFSHTITGTNSATAQVIETIRRAVAVRFTKRMAGIQVRVLEDGDVVREEHPDGTIRIIHYPKGRLLQLDPATRQAIRGTISGGDIPEAQSVLALFRDRITARDGAFVGRVRLGVTEADEYRFAGEDGEAVVSVWVDPQSRLPIKAVLQGPEWHALRETVFEAFDWNPAFDPGQMAIAVPPGYALDERHTIDVTMTTFAEQRRACIAALACGSCLTEFLAIYADCFQGRFPDGLDAKAVKIEGWDLMRPRPEEIEIHGEQALPMRVEHVSKQWERLLSLTSALQSLGREIHYLGKGRSRGDGEGPIAWWQTFEGATCIVVADDLSFSEVAGASPPTAAGNSGAHVDRKAAIRLSAHVDNAVSMMTPFREDVSLADCSEQP
jgi:hypothetical protein